MTHGTARSDCASSTPLGVFVRRAVGLVLTSASLTSCATLDVSHDRPAIEGLLAARGAPDLGWQNNGCAGNDALMADVLAKPMTIDLAVRAAMLKSPQLQQVYGQLGLARADVLDAIQVANPRIGVSSLALEGGPGSQLVTGVALPLIDLLTLPTRSRLAHADYERARYEVAAAIFGVSLDVESAWYRYVAAHQVSLMRKAVGDALRTSADLAQRFFDAGNITELQLNREKAAASQAGIEAARASVAERLARLDLDTLIGLSGGETKWSSDALLPLPVATEDDPAELQRIASTTSLELLAARKGTAVAASAASITRRFRLLGATTVGYDREREVDRSVIKGPTLDLELPIFNQGGARVARAEARLQIARARLARIELSNANSVVLGAERVRVLSGIVGNYRSALVPERETVAAQSQLEQNFALIGQFEVLQARTQQYDAYQGLIEAVRDYWLARTDLVRLIGSRLPSDAAAKTGEVSAAKYLTPPLAPAMDHSIHGGHGQMNMEMPMPPAPASPASPVPATPAPPAGHDHGHAPPDAAPPAEHHHHSGTGQ
jgi:cobalt-zinc-cadmium efflux system outer membrane protein